ncbi:hypothetical protein Tsubulata_033453 [Turnera subulata]|uniref:Uncharacterized protein n=1 Tax=Turnera subulata TaxID=218843 RepID=A0A9Q0FR45_9ROSI|nr:hypothetical protein Tsubulata_033453 [Turnera subulata]
MFAPILHQTPTPTHLAATSSRWPTRRRMFLRRRRKLATVRLGGTRSSGRGFFLVRVLRKMRLRWLKLQYLRMLRKLKEYYRNMIKDFQQAGATLEAYQQKLLMETSFLAVPGMGVSFSTFSSVAQWDSSRFYIM